MSDRDGAPDDALQHKTWVKVSFKTFGNRDRGSTPSPHQAGQGTCTPKLSNMLGTQQKSRALDQARLRISEIYSVWLYRCSFR